MTAEIRLGTAPQYNVLTVGEERTKVLIIDGLLDDVNPVYERARGNGNFAPEAGSYYPGVRAKLPRDYGMILTSFADNCIRQQYAIEDELNATPCAAFYSIVTTPEDRLSPLQRIPHFDRHERHVYAVMHYVSPGEFGGTGFFRHKPTGFERVGVDRREPYLSAVTGFFAEHGEPPAAYIGATTDQYELIGSVDYKPNRLLIYPGNLLHSGLIRPATDIYAGQGLARLTANVIINYL